MPIPEQLKDKLENLRKDVSIPGKWTKRENLHLTVHFFGATPADKIDDMSRKIDKAVHGLKPFELEMDKIMWKKGRYDQMIWAKLNSHVCFREMARNLYSALEIDSSKYPTPHITLARVKQKDFQTDEMNISLEGLVLPVKQIEFWESKLGGGKGPEYTSLKTFILSGNSD